MGQKCFMVLHASHSIKRRNIKDHIWDSPPRMDYPFPATSTPLRFCYPRDNRPLRIRFILAAATVSAQYEHVSFISLYWSASRAYKFFIAVLLSLISSGASYKPH